MNCWSVSMGGHTCAKPGPETRLSLAWYAAIISLVSCTLISQRSFTVGSTRTALERERESIRPWAWIKGARFPAAA